MYDVRCGVFYYCIVLEYKVHVNVPKTIRTHNSIRGLPGAVVIQSHFGFNVSLFFFFFFLLLCVVVFPLIFLYLLRMDGRTRRTHRCQQQVRFGRNRGKNKSNNSSYPDKTNMMELFVVECATLKMAESADVAHSGK